ncbi:MAG: hypothetical protein IJ584_12650 [Bacteroidales bacterium]|nr:hypothetical protein [Bacteroidales bacterium]
MLTLDAFRPIYQAFLESGKTVRQFCEDYPIHESRFYHWQAKLRQEAASQDETGAFLPVSINNHGGKVVMVGGASRPGMQGRLPQPACEVSFPNGVTVRLNGSVPVEMLRELILLPR